MSDILRVAENWDRAFEAVPWVSLIPRFHCNWVEPLPYVGRFLSSFLLSSLSSIYFLPTFPFFFISFFLYSLFLLSVFCLSFSFVFLSFFLYYLFIIFSFCLFSSFLSLSFTFLKENNLLYFLKKKVNHYFSQKLLSGESSDLLSFFVHFTAIFNVAIYSNRALKIRCNVYLDLRGKSKRLYRKCKRTNQIRAYSVLLDRLADVK